MGGGVDPPARMCWHSPMSRHTMCRAYIILCDLIELALILAAVAAFVASMSLFATILLGR